MSNKLLGEEGKSKYTPEEAALLMRLRVLVTMRWLAILGVTIATLVASMVFHTDFPTLPVYTICAVMALYNLVGLRQIQSLRAKRRGLVIQKARLYSNIHISFDLIMLTALLHFIGGIENPFIFFFVFHIIAASIVLPYRRVYILSTSAILMVSLLVGLEYAGVISHNHINFTGFTTPELYKEWGYILAVIVTLAVLLYGTTYMATAISGELRKRQRQVVKLREQLLEERTRELEECSNEIARLHEERSRFLRFLGIAAHDLKAPLTAIQGFLWVMLGGYSGELTDKQRNMMERSSRRITELLELISDLLDIPRIEAGLIFDEMGDTSLCQVVKRSVDDLRNLAKQKKAKLKAELPKSLPKIRGSTPRLQQVITELLTNAINYSPGGLVTIMVQEKGNDIRVEVMDTGIGIPHEDLPRVFDEFFRGSNVETKGTGLGLSIVKRLVEVHGGRIWVESPCSKSNTGSKFTFTLPKKSET